MSGYLKSLVKTWSRGHTQQQGSLGNVVLHLGKCHLRTTRNLCHKRIAGVIKGECLYFLLHLSSLFHYFIIFMYHLRKFQKSIFGKKKETNLKEMLRNVNSGNCLSVVRLYIPASLC